MNIRVVVSKNDCDSISDFNVESWYKRVLEETPEGGNIIVATGTMLDRIRLAHVKEEVFIEAIIFEDKIILVGENGEVTKWHEGMLDQHDCITAKLLGW
tara:strand:- start:106 stop:402 length:297 start_codon:yes stop_codon:yes gene_type:complete